MYTEPVKGLSLEDCSLYHSFSDSMLGHWDLRHCVDDYLGNLDFKNKRVIDVGAASGYLSFEMEKRGAEVVSYDMPDSTYWDQLKFPGYIPHQATDRSKKLDNAIHYMHEKLNSKCKFYRASIYDDLPDELGDFDIALFGTILAHLRDPMLALMNILYKVKERAILVNPFFNTQKGSFFYKPNKKHFNRIWWSICFDDIEKMVNAIGWEIEHVKNISPLQLVNVDVPTERSYKSVVIKRVS